MVFLPDINETYHITRNKDRQGMNLKEKLQSLLQQGGLYRSQGLLIEAIAKYEEAINVLQAQKQIKNKTALIAGINTKLRAAKAELEKFENATDTPEVSSKIQDLIKRQFAYSDDKDKAALEGAMALAKFGQFQRALEEFGQMIDTEAIRVEAAKNVIRCHMALFSVDEAIAQFERWVSDDRFTPDQINKVRIFFESTLSRSKIDKSLPPVAQPETPEKAATNISEPTIEMPDMGFAISEAPAGGLSDVHIPEMADDEILDINSMEFVLDSGPDKGKQVELNVSFQNGDVVSILIPGRDKDIIAYMEQGRKLDNAQFYSPMAIFSGSGVVFSKSKIESGPRRGDFNVDIKVITT